MLHNFLIIWSKDRACQLNLLLRSMKRAEFNPAVCIIFKASSIKYQDAYNKLKSRYKSDHYFFTQEFEDNLERSFENISNHYIFLTKSNSNLNGNIGFSTDDTVLYRKMPITNEQFPLLKYNECFSLRLGLNTLLQDYSVGSIQPPLNRYINGGETISWNPQEYHPQHNYGYPYSLDMHFFNSENIQDCLEEFSFKNTNELEGGLSHRRQRITDITSFKKSIAVNIPVNNMSKMTVSGKEHAYSFEELNNAYLNNYEIDLDAIWGYSDRVVGCHQEFPLKLRKVNS